MLLVQWSEDHEAYLKDGAVDEQMGGLGEVVLGTNKEGYEHG